MSVPKSFPYVTVMDVRYKPLEVVEEKAVADANTRPIDLLMEIEGLSIGALKRRWRQARPYHGPLPPRS